MKITKSFKIALSLFILIILIAAASWLFIQSRNHEQNKDKDSSKISSRIQVENGVTTIDLSTSVQANSGITTIKLIQTLHQAQLTAYGSVVSIQDLSKNVQSFESGKALLAKSQENLLISQKNFERTKNLYDKDLASEQDYQASQAAFLSDKADVNSALSNLSSQKSSILEQWGNEISKWVFNGSKELQHLLNLNESLIQISLPPEETNIKAPDKIFIQSPSGNNKRIICRFVSAGHLANSQFQTKTLYYIALGASLSGGMNIKAFLPVGKNLNGVIVPASSIVWYQGKAWIYAEKLPNKFIRAEVDVDNPVDDGFFVPTSRDKGIINPGVIVVKNGAQLLLSEELAPVQGKQSSGGDND
jgi:hypothetical protein